MKTFKKQSLNRKDYRLEEVTASICRVLLTPNHGILCDLYLDLGHS